MSALLDSLCGQQRLAECARNERSMLIPTHESPGLDVIEEWRYEVAMEAEGE